MGGVFVIKKGKAKLHIMVSNQALLSLKPSRHNVYVQKGHTSGEKTFRLVA